MLERLVGEERSRLGSSPKGSGSTVEPRAAVEVVSLALAGAIVHLCYPLAPVPEEQK